MNALLSISLAATLTVPASVKTALHQKYPVIHAKITREKEKGNYEANWGGKSGEDTSVMFTPGERK